MGILQGRLLISSMSFIAQPLALRNSLAVNATARRWRDWVDCGQLSTLHRQYAGAPILAYGEGTNLLLAADPEELCLHSLDQSIKYRSEGDSLLLETAAGVNWNWLVRHCLANGWWGLENLISIPGSCGAAPVQNIGAYGAELVDNCVWVECFDWRSGELMRLEANDCAFGYRNSLFKKERQLVITRLALRLTTNRTQWREMQQARMAHTSLAGLDEQVREQPRLLAAAIANLRARKLPDFHDTPNAGSFFHNPVVDYAAHGDLIAKLAAHSAAWRLDNDRARLSAAWLIDATLGKGYRRGVCALSRKHALCVVNEHGASGAQLLEFADHIRERVFERFGVNLEIEPRVVGC